MEGAGIPIENSKGEVGSGQEEINVRYAEALEMADRHVILKNGGKEIARQQGKAITFMAKYNYRLAGSSSHIHNSLWSADGKTPLFFDKKAEWTMSPLMASNGSPASSNMPREFTWFLAPYINSYKRFQVGTWAPTKIIWSRDNRTAGFRLCGEGTKGIRIECRIGGADLNPYLAFAALIAAGLAGIDEKLELQKPFVGDAYQGEPHAGDPEDAARRDRNAGEVEDAEARRSATTSSSTMSTLPGGSSSNTTAASPIGSCIGGSSGIEPFAD